MEFYVTNISKKDIHLSDLCIVVRSMTTMNIFGKKSIITKEQLLKSIMTGSLSKRLENKSLIVRVTKPTNEKIQKIQISDSCVKSKNKTAIVVEKKYIEELDLLYKKDKNSVDEQMIKEILEGED